MKTNKYQRPFICILQNLLNMKYIVSKSSPQLDEKYEEYILYLPFLYDHREEIYSNAEYFYALIPFVPCTLKEHQACIGALLRAFDKGEPYRTINTKDNTIEFIATFSGNSLSGTTRGLKTVLYENDTIQVKRFGYCCYLSLVHKIAVGYDEYNFPYHESSLTLHDVIRQLEECEG